MGPGQVDTGKENSGKYGCKGARDEMEGVEELKDAMVNDVVQKENM